jgi:hypothetical protein
MAEDNDSVPKAEALTLADPQVTLSAREDTGARRLTRMSLYAAGTTNIDRNGAVIMPPTIGAAI